MNNYASGRNAEYKIKNLLVQKGYKYVIRSAGSHSPIDLLAANGRWKLAIQVKRRKYISKEEKELLVSWASSFDAAPVFASKVKGKWTFHLVNLRGLKEIEV